MSHWTLPRLAGLANAADILLTGRLFDGHEAKAMGVANRCLPADDVLPAALDVARDIAVNVAPVSAAISKRLLWESVARNRTPADVAWLESELHRHVMGREDAKEGVMAFLERRDPAWSMRVSTDWPEWPDVGSRP
jgi:enoyl-CoA hydratase/carnithine racemase